MLGEAQKKKIYLNVKNGQIVARMNEGDVAFSYVRGRLEAIYTKKRSFNNGETVYYYLDLRDDESDDVYALGFPEANNVFKSLILQLATATDFDDVTIQPYSKNGYDKVQVYAGGEKLNWVVDELPPIKEVVVGSRVVKDDSARMNLIRYYADVIAQKIAHK